MDWKKLCVKGQQSILDVVGVIDRGACQLALVVDTEGKLQGIVSDGDVRRAILKGCDLQTPVQQIMNCHPVTVRKAEGHGAALITLRKQTLRYIAVVDDSQNLVDFWFLEHLLRFNAVPNPVIIMAGGLGSRLAPLTEDIPKPMLPVGGRPLLDHILQHFITQGFRSFYIAVNYKAQYIKDYFTDGANLGASIEYIHEDKRLGTAGALSLLPEKPSLPAITINGDILTQLDFAALLQAHVEKGPIATMVVKQHAMQIPYGVVRTDAAGHMLSIEEKPQHNFSVSAGINVLSPAAFAYIPHNTFFDMPSLFTALIAAEKIPHVYAMHDYWLDIGQISDYKKANEEFPRYLQQQV